MGKTIKILRFLAGYYNPKDYNYIHTGKLWAEGSTEGKAWKEGSDWSVWKFYPLLLVIFLAEAYYTLGKINFFFKNKMDLDKDSKLYTHSKH